MSRGGRGSTSTRRRWWPSSSRRTSRCRSSGRRWPRTSSSPSTSAATSARPSARRRVRQLIGRVVRTITAWGREGGYFATEADGDAFRDELTHILLYQMASFNSPVWFNVGVEPQPQCSACFINSVEDTMDSILGLAKTEGMLFKYGSGTGSNLSAHPLLARAPRRRRHRLRPGLVHARLRLIRRRDQVGRQDPPRREDGHPQRRPSRHRRLHRVEGERREEGVGADRGRLRRRASTRRAARTTRCSSRTPTTPSASPTSSCARTRRTATGTTRAVTDQQRSWTRTRRAT